MEKLPKMHRYRIPVWNRHLRPEYVDQISIPNEHLFLQLIQEGMHVHKCKHYPNLGSGFLQITSQTLPTGRVLYDLYLVSVHKVDEDESLRELYMRLSEYSLDSFATADDWNKRLRENL